MCFSPHFLYHIRVILRSELALCRILMLEKSHLSMPHLFLKLKNPIHQRLTRRRTSRHINIHRNNPIAAPRDTVAVMIIPATVGARSHADDPAGLRHLVVHLAQGGSHLVGESTSYYHDVGLARRGSKDYSQAILVVAGS